MNIKKILTGSLVAVVAAVAFAASGQSASAQSLSIGTFVDGSYYTNNSPYKYVASAEAPTIEPATCDTGEILRYGEISRAIWSGVADGAEGPLSDDQLVATSTFLYRFWNIEEGVFPINVWPIGVINYTYKLNSPSRTIVFPVDLAGSTGEYQSEDPEAPCYVAPADEDDNDNDEAPSTTKGEDKPSASQAAVKSKPAVMQLPYTAGGSAVVAAAVVSVLAGAVIAASRLVKNFALSRR